ncbi:proteasome assembly chaperone 3-like [Frankliniella occidentalis]|uniref:Proteasome assembly chaperone 3-like n=1 Tax=Frankliniella occidentalis TaxID=133901 RepID=A0A9C6TTE2_FRAOC|nr:proteasome assembly chaperone 3-like [Frankliniella occidentalis]
MACVESLEKLSLLDVSEPSVIKPFIQQSPLKETVTAAKIDGVHTDIVITEFVNRIFIVLTQRQSFSSLLLVSKDGPKTFEGKAEDIYTVKSIFGVDSEQSGNLVARFLSEHTCMNKPALFALGLKDHSPRTVRALRDIINQHKSW